MAKRMKLDLNDALNNFFSIDERKDNEIVRVPTSSLHEYKFEYYKNGEEVIIKHPFNINKESEDYQTLSRLIEKQGILEPILVWNNPYGEGYQILSGHRRWTIAQDLGLPSVPILIMDCKDEVEAASIMQAANRYREHISPMETARAYKLLYEAMFVGQGKRTDLTSATGLPKFQNGLTVYEKIAEKVGVSHQTVKNYYALTRLIPEIQDLVEIGRVAVKVGYQLSLLSADMQKTVFQYYVDYNVTPSVAQAQALVSANNLGNLDNEFISDLLRGKKANQIRSEGAEVSKFSKRIEALFPEQAVTKDQKEIAAYKYISLGKEFEKMLDKLPKEYTEDEKKISVLNELIDKATNIGLFKAQKHNQNIEK